MPHSSEGLVDVLHDLRWGVAPAQLEQLLPNMASVAVNDRLRDASKKLMYHDGFVLLWHRVERFLNDVAPKGIHAQSKSVTANSLSDQDHLFGRAMLKAALNEKVPEAVDHERVRLVNDSLNDLMLLFTSADFELLLQKDGGLLVIVADNFVDDILPVAAHGAVQEASVVERLCGIDVDGWSMLLRLLMCSPLSATKTELGGSWRQLRAYRRLLTATSAVGHRIWHLKWVRCHRWRIACAMTIARLRARVHGRRVESVSRNKLRSGRDTIWTTYGERCGICVVLKLPRSDGRGALLLPYIVGVML